MVEAQSLDFESDQLQLEDKSERVVLSGNVKAWNDTGTIKANRLEIYYRSGGDTVRYFEAFGDVRLRYPDLRGTGNYAFRDVSADTLLLQGNAYVKRREDEFWADRIQVDLENSEVKMTKGVRGSLAPRNKGDNNE